MATRCIRSLMDMPQEDEADNEAYAEKSYSCFDGGKTREDGSRWSSGRNGCTMCRCQRGKVVCDKIVCPHVSCSNPVILAGECCSTCLRDLSAENMVTRIADKAVAHASGGGGDGDDGASHAQQKGCLFAGDKKWHPYGSTWHPYIPPWGFTRCVLCRCQERTGQVNCTKLTCPDLHCPKEDQHLEKPTDCCKKCKERPFPESVTTTLRTMQKDINAEGACFFKGQFRANHEEWSPRISSFGTMKCIKCFCKDGKAKCKRHKCPKVDCPRWRRVYRDGECCPRCLEPKKSKGKS